MKFVSWAAVLIFLISLFSFVSSLGFEGDSSGYLLMQASVAVVGGSAAYIYWKTRNKK